MLKNPHFLSGVLLSLCLGGFSPMTYAAKVAQVKGTRALIDLEGGEATAGDEFFLINPDTQKKTAIIRIKQVKNGKAVADILKGSGANIGHTLQARGTSDRSVSGPVPEDSVTPVTKNSDFSKLQKNSGGFLGEYLMTMMSANFSRATPTPHTASTDMKGTGMGIAGFYNHMLNKNFSVFGELGLQPFNASGSTPLTDCENSMTCDVKINYLAGYVSGRYYFLQTKHRLWAGIGVGLLMAISKSSTVLNSSQISSNQVYSFSLGGDYQLNRKNFIPYGFEYAMFPASSSVKASMMIFKVGYGWNF